MISQVRIISKDGKPKNTDIFNAGTEEQIKRVQAFNLYSHVDQPYATVTLEIQSPELDVLAFVEKVKIGHEWFYPQSSFYGAENEEMETMTIDGITIGYKQMEDKEYKLNIKGAENDN